MSADAPNTENYCYLCGNVWESDSPNPKRCPRCGSALWNTRHDTYAECPHCGTRWNRRTYRECCPECGKIPSGGNGTLRCSQCDYEWTPKSLSGPKKCPSCRSDKWMLPKMNTFCCHVCGHLWKNRSENPKKCPKCQSTAWNAPRIRLWCVRCGHKWSPRGGKTSANIKICPHCKSPDWHRLPETAVCKTCGRLFIRGRSDRCPGCSGFKTNRAATCGFCGTSWLGGGDLQDTCPRCGMNRTVKCIEAWSRRTYRIIFAEDNGSASAYLWDGGIPVASMYLHDLLRTREMTMSEISYYAGNPDCSDFWEKVKDFMLEHSGDHRRYIPYFMKRLNLSEEDAEILAIHFDGMRPEAIALMRSMSLEEIRKAFDRIMAAYSDSGIVVDDTVFTDDPFSRYRILYRSPAFAVTPRTVCT